MAQDDIMRIVERHPEGITGNRVKVELGVKWGVTQQLERLRDKGMVKKEQGETRLQWIYYPTKTTQDTEKEIKTATKMLRRLAETIDSISDEETGSE